MKKRYITTFAEKIFEEFKVFDSKQAMQIAEFLDSFINVVAVWDDGDGWTARWNSETKEWEEVETEEEAEKLFEGTKSIELANGWHIVYKKDD